MDRTELLERLRKKLATRAERLGLRPDEEPGRCLRPDTGANAKRIFSFAEAVDGNGQTLMSAGKPLAWGGSAVLCTRPARFETNDHSDCTARGLTQAGFAQIETGKGPAIVRFK